MITYPQYLVFVLFVITCIVTVHINNRRTVKVRERRDEFMDLTAILLRGISTVSLENHTAELREAVVRARKTLRAAAIDGE